MSRITPSMVEHETQRFWSAFCSKSVEQFSQFYSPSSVVFGPAAERAESGSVASMRRAREYMHPEARVTVSLGHIEVQTLSDTTAVASYPYSFAARNVAKDFRGSVDQVVDHARVTQVFELRDDGALQIIHEHISVVMKV